MPRAIYFSVGDSICRFDRPTSGRQFQHLSADLKPWRAPFTFVSGYLEQRRMTTWLAMKPAPPVSRMLVGV